MAMVGIKYVEMARLIKDFSFLTGVPVFSKDSHMWFREYSGSMYSQSTAAKMRMPLSLFIQLVYLGRITPCSSMPDNCLKLMVDKEYKEMREISNIRKRVIL